jgi:3-hydroxyacyl-CoA dehydrogenase
MIEPPRIAVLGAGVPGVGVVHALAERGRDVRLDDGDAAPLDRARASIRAGARLARGSREGGERSR